MTTAAPYTSAELQEKYIVWYNLLSGSVPVVDCVRHASGPRSGQPYLYNDRATAKSDLHFEDGFDKIVPAAEFFEMLRKKEKPV